VKRFNEKPAPVRTTTPAVIELEDEILEALTGGLPPIGTDPILRCRCGSTGVCTCCVCSGGECSGMTCCTCTCSGSC
jgi:hypothetical protein